MKKHIKTISSLITLTIILTLPYFVFGQTSGTEDGILTRLNSVAGKGGYDVAGGADLTSIVGLIIQAILGLLGAVFIILMVYAGYTWMTAAGNEPKIEKAKEMIQTSIIGLIIVLSSWAIWAFILKNFIGG